MKSLFARIWLSYWLMMALTLVVALALSYALAVKRSEETGQLSPLTFARTAQAQLSRRGQDGLTSWVIGQNHTHPELQFFFVDEFGHELLGRAISGRPLANPQNALVPIVSAPGGRSFRLYMRRTANFSFGAWQLMFQPLLLIVLAIAVTGLGSAALARQLAAPVVRLRSDVRTIAAGEIHERMSPAIARRSDEVGGLARDIDLMTAHLRSLIESKEELLRDISHELRSPLARLRIATSLLRGDWTGPKTQAFDRIDREVQRLDVLIGQILQFSRVQANPELNFVAVDLGEILDEAVADARLEANGTKPIEFERAYPILVEGDRTLIASAIENVLRNAIRFGPTGMPIELVLERIGNTARVSVADHGPGIRPDDLHRICRPFFRAEGSSGVGLGLSIAERVAALHGGRIAIRNRPKGGLVVQLFFRTSGSDDAPLTDFSNAPLIGKTR